MAARSQAHEVKQHLDEVKSLRERLGTARWRRRIGGILDRVLGAYERLLSMLLRRSSRSSGCRRWCLGSGASADRWRLAASRRRGGHEEASGRVRSVASGADARCRGPGWRTSDDVGNPPRAGGHRPGYGRLGADAYEGAERVECRHEELAVGQRCPVCGQGRLYALPPGVEIRIDGNALLSAIRYEVEKLRCSACGEVFTAPLPVEAR